MAIIYTYPTKAAAVADKVLISDSADENKTKNASISSIRDAIDVVDVISAGPGISVSNPTGNVTVGNTGVLSLIAGSNISLSGSTGNVTISTSASNVDGSGTTNRIPIWTDSNTLGDSQISQNGASVGVGTALGTAVGSLEVYNGSLNTQLFVTCPDTSQAAINFGGISAKSKGRINYSDNSDEMMFHTNSFEKMRISSNGDVGIGTTFPFEKLQVAGKIRVDGNGANSLQLYRSASTQPNFIEFYDKDTLMPEALVGYTSNNDNFQINNAKAASTEFFTNGIERMAITSAGYIGIGTPSPSTKMTIVDPAPVLRFINTSGTNNSYYMNVGMFGGKATIDAYTNSNAAAPLYFSTGGSNRMQLSAAGNLSIGPFPGTEKLNVDGTVDLTNLKVSGAQGNSGDVLTSSGTGVSWQAAASPISGTPGVVPVFDALGTGIADSTLQTTGSGSTQSFRFNTLGDVLFDGTILGNDGGTFSNSDLITESTSALHIKGALKDGGNFTGNSGQLLSSTGAGGVQWRPAYNNGTINAGCASVGSSSNVASNPRQASFTFPNEVGSSNFGPCIPIMAPLTVQLIAIKWNGANAPVIGANGTVNFKLGKLTSRTGVPDTQEGTVNYTNLVDLTGLQITSADSGTWIFKFMNLAGLGATYVAQDIMVLVFPRPTTGWTGTGATNGDLQVTMQVAYA